MFKNDKFPPKKIIQDIEKKHNLNYENDFNKIDEIFVQLLNEKALEFIEQRQNNNVQTDENEVTQLYYYIINIMPDLEQSQIFNAYLNIIYEDSIKKN